MRELEESLVRGVESVSVLVSSWPLCFIWEPQGGGGGGVGEILGLSTELTCGIVN